MLIFVDDQVYMEDEDDRKEYVLHDRGNIYMGGAKQIFGKPWNFGQVGSNRKSIEDMKMIKKTPSIVKINYQAT